MIRAAVTRLAANSAIYGIGSIMQRFAGMLLLPFYTSVLSKSDYGVLSLLGVVTASLIGIFNLGTANSISIIYFSESKKRSKEAVIWSGSSFLAFNSILILTLLYPVLPFLSYLVYGTDQYSTIIGLALIGLSFSVVADPFMSYLRMNSKPFQYIQVTILVFIATTCISIWLVLFKKAGIIGMIIAQAAGQLLLLLLSLCLIGRKIPFSYNTGFIKPLVFIGFPSVIGSFATLLLSFSDRWLLKHYLGFSELGVYSIGSSFGMFMALLVGAFDTAWPPFFASYINRREEARNIFPLIFTYYVLGFGSLCLVFFAVAKPITHLMTAKPFHEAYQVIGLVAFSQFLYGAYSILGTGIYYSKKLSKLSLFKWLAAVINITLNIILIPKFGIVGAAVAMSLGYLSLLPMAYFASRAVFPLSYEWRRISAFLMVLTSMIVFILLINRWFDVVTSAIAGIVCIFIIIIYIYQYLLTIIESAYLISVFDRQFKIIFNKLRCFYA